MRISMIAKLALIPVAAATVILAGCASPITPANDPQVDERGDASSSTDGTDEIRAITPIPVDVVLRGNECINGWYGRTLADVAVDAPPPPPGWERGYQHPQIYPEISVWTCKRISVGPLEKGPLTLFLETHDNFTPPKACRGEGSWHGYRTANMIWSDSVPLADNFSQLFGIDVELAESASLEQDPDGGGGFSWKWPDGEGGHVDVVQSDMNEAVVDQYISRVATFPEAGGVVLLDFIDIARTTNGDGPATGALTGPHISAPHEGKLAVGQGSISRTELEVHAQWFENLDCSS